jgi:hypothetical protein
MALLEDQTAQVPTTDAETISEEPLSDSAPKQDDSTSKNSSTDDSEDQEFTLNNSTDHSVFYRFLEVMTWKKGRRWQDSVRGYAEELRTALCNIDKRITEKGSVLGPDFRDTFDHLDLANLKLAVHRSTSICKAVAISVPSRTRAISCLLSRR